MQRVGEGVALHEERTARDACPVGHLLGPLALVLRERDHGRVLRQCWQGEEGKGYAAGVTHGRGADRKKSATSYDHRPGGGVACGRYRRAAIPDRNRKREGVRVPTFVPFLPASSPLHERRDQARVRPGLYPLAEALVPLPGAPWQRPVWPHQALPPDGEA